MEKRKIDLVVAGYVIHENKVLLIHHNKLDLWLPVGGHIEENETPDQAVIREFKEETNLDIEIIGLSDSPRHENVVENLSLPIHANVHSVGDHDHSCLFYLCKAKNPQELKINQELKNFAWFSKEELEKDCVPLDVKHIALKAFDKFSQLP